MSTDHATQVAYQPSGDSSISCSCGWTRSMWCGSEQEAEQMATMHVSAATAQ